jgi:hypothetical protein
MSIQSSIAMQQASNASGERYATSQTGGKNRKSYVVIKYNMRFTAAVLLLAAAPAGVAVFSEGTDLGGGIVTRTDVEYLADLALDVRDIRQYIDNGDGGAVAMQVYNDGRNSYSQPGIPFTLHQLSDNLAKAGAAVATPNHLFHLYGISQRSTDLSKLQSNAYYADSYVRASIQNGRVLGPDGVVALSMWVYATYLLYNGLDICQKMTNADNPAQFDLRGGGMDEFIGLWIGSGQLVGDSNKNSLYSMTQDASEMFETGGTEANANTNIKLLYQEGANLLSISGACTKESPDSPRRLWNIVTRIIAQMHVPLMQRLIESILKKDALATELYAIALVPQIAQCRPSSYKRLNEALLAGTPNFSKTEQILKDLQSVYDCLGFTCEDVGQISVTSSTQMSECDHDTVRTMAQYRPTTGVHPVSFLICPPL